MPVTNADIMKAINTVWDDNNLDIGFKQYWEENRVDEPALVIGSLITSPNPYCKCQVGRGKTIHRMSDSRSFLREVRDIPVEFTVYVRTFSKESGEDGEDPAFVPIGTNFGEQSHAQVAESRIKEIIEVYGGHPSQQPAELVLDHGGVLLMQYQNDRLAFVTKTTTFIGIIWELNYIFRVDVPVAI